MEPHGVSPSRQTMPIGGAKGTIWVWTWGLALAGLLALALPAISHAAETDTRAGLTIWPEPRPVAEVQFVDGAGKPHTLADFKGKVVLLNLWATWCAPCRQEMPTLDRLQAQLGGPDFQVLALSIDLDGVRVVRDFYREVGIRHLGIYIDENASAISQLGAFGLPATLLLDREGRELGRKLGEATWDSPEVVAYLREVIASSRRQ
ncbi:TlpA family protein disulfide reductase [Pseudomonas sp. GCM10022186]|uniref:TlpA family protein disulfide reductase n=1 Tax=Pseudomonas sp. GCM10022186 TaxID=3252650 RepID=UPI0036192F5A